MNTSKHIYKCKVSQTTVGEKSPKKSNLFLFKLLSKTSLNFRAKITEKVSFNIASEASYVYISSGQKFIKIAKNVAFWRIFDNPKFAVK